MCRTTISAISAATRVVAYKCNLVDLGDRLLVPGFVDGHAHAPQYSFVGVGMHLPLLDWLEQYTFPSEVKFADVEYARAVYAKAVRRYLFNGTTTCSYFATVHLEASKALADIVGDLGQRGFVGKVNMDRNCTDALREATADSIERTREFVAYVQSKNPLVTPVVTPRFVPSTSSELMAALGAISREHEPKLLVQSHLSENRADISWRSYMAHCVWCSADERAVLRSRQSAVIHCPNSNFSLSSGVLNVRRLLDESVKRKPRWSGLRNKLASISTGQGVLPRVTDRRNRHRLSNLRGDAEDGVFYYDAVMTDRTSREPLTDAPKARIAAYCTCDQIALFKLLKWLDRPTKVGATLLESAATNPRRAQTEWKNKMYMGVQKDAFYFATGCCVFWGLTREEELMHLQTLAPFSTGPVAQIEAEDMLFCYGEASRVANDEITLSSSAVAEKLAISFAMSQSAKLDVFEERVEDRIKNTKHIPSSLATTGSIQYTKKDISKLIGQLFIELADIISVEVLNQELTRQHGTKLEWIIIWLLLVEVVIAVVWEITVKDLLGYFRH
ncbi:hypothetical protein PybrP1_012740 [[Pythium] brassicae (nom. inval.)]|nr:hypothetical protein PybrP1_012740 [[Pythium] brassicae (nom. inval.)]